MTEPAKRFWTAASVVPEGAGFGVALDARALKTPAGKPLCAPTHAAAAAVAAEWNAQTDRIRPTTMPVTRAVNVAIDRVTPDRAAVAEIVAEYGATDMLCYRAPWPGPLAARQAERWDPVLAWLEARHGAPLICVEGVMHVAQPAPSLAALRAAVEGFDPFALTALHELVSIAGSLGLGLAVAEGRLTGADAWAISRTDEDFQIEHWGEDDEAAALAARRHRDFLAAERFLQLLRA
jgi:chaperone required for assembly of F1-ATPase